MESQQSSTNHWSILIGINFYGSQVMKVPQLRGAVNDVREMEKYLQTRMPGYIKAFTATAPENSQGLEPVESPSDWPTYENITQHLKYITLKGAPGDSVYFHFSGHGVRPIQPEDKLSHPETGDLCLPLYDQFRGIRYLRGTELATILNGLVQKSIFVTVTLDCCFSGSVVRHGRNRYSIRRLIDYNPAIDAAYPATMPTIERYTEDDTLRKARSIPRLLISSARYTIFAACSPHEVAQEIYFRSQNKYAGALSHFLLRALVAPSDRSMNVQSVYQQICLAFRLHWSLQNPLRFGRKDVSFFGELVQQQNQKFVPVATGKDRRLVLDSGIAHGVSQGNEFALWPFGTPEESDPWAHAIAITVEGLTSVLEISETFQTTSHTTKRWVAKKLSVSTPKVHVRILVDSIYDQLEGLSKDEEFLFLVRGDDENYACEFEVCHNPENGYQILDGSSNPVANVPCVSSSAVNACEQVVHVLHHLATFKCVQSIENQNPDACFEGKIVVEFTKDGIPIKDHKLTVQHHQELVLNVKNFLDKPIYLTIFSMGAFWEIENVLDDNVGEEYKVIPPKQEEFGENSATTGTQCIPLALEKNDGLEDMDQKTEDASIKVFVTSASSPFSVLTQAKLALPNPDDIVRGRVRHDNISAFLSALSEPRRGSEKTGKGAQWMTRTLFVQIV